MGANSSCDCFNGDSAPEKPTISTLNRGKIPTKPIIRNPNFFSTIDSEPESSVKPKPKTESKPKKKLGISDFSLIRVLGRGAFGKVYLVEKKSNKKIYAMKVLKKEDILKRNTLESAKNEKEIMRKASHEFVVNLRYSFQNERNLYLVMDFMPGGELFMHLRRMRKFDESVVRFYAAEVILALEYLHEKLDVIYRDLKPENILLDADGHIKITDFGLSKTAKLSYSFCGTPEYLAPEILLGQGYGKAVDWWSLGCLIFEMLAGYPPFQHKNRKQLYQAILTNDPLFPEYFSSSAVDLLKKLLVSNPKERLGYASIAEIKRHPFFAKTNWSEVTQKKEKGPIIPEDTIYTPDPAWKLGETPLSDIRFLHDPRNNFKNFSYNPDILPEDERELNWS